MEMGKSREWEKKSAVIEGIFLTTSPFFNETPRLCNLQPFKSITDANLQYFGTELTTSIQGILHLLAGPFLCTSVSVTDLRTLATHIARSGSDPELAVSELTAIETLPQCQEGLPFFR